MTAAGQLARRGGRPLKYGTSLENPRSPVRARRTEKSIDTLRDLWEAAGVTQPARRGDDEGFPGLPGPPRVRHQIRSTSAVPLNVDIVEPTGNSGQATPQPRTLTPAALALSASTSHATFNAASATPSNAGNPTGFDLRSAIEPSDGPPTPAAAVRDIEKAFGNEVRDLFAVEPAALTAPEAGYLLRFKDADSLRARAAKARDERDGREGDGSLQGSGAEDEVDPSGAAASCSRSTTRDRRTMAGKVPAPALCFQRSAKQPVTLACRSDSRSPR